MASVEAERMFSEMNRVLTKLRNSMSVGRMSKKIVITRGFKLLTREQQDLVLRRALELFLSLKKRRRGAGQLD